MGIGDARRHGLGDGPGQHELQEVPGGLGVVRRGRPDRGQLRLDGLVDDEVDHRLRDAEVGGGDALVEAAESRSPVHPPHHLRGRHGAPVRVVVQLQPRLHEPDRVGGGARHEAGAGGGADVDGGRVGRQDGGVVEELLGLRVGAEVDGARRRHAHQVGAQALEQRAGPLPLHDVPDALDDAHALDAGASGHAAVGDGQDLGVAGGHGGQSSPLVGRQQRLASDMVARALRRGYSREVYIVNVETVGRLLSRLHHLQGACYYGTCCAGGSGRE